MFDLNQSAEYITLYKFLEEKGKYLSDNIAEDINDFIVGMVKLIDTKKNYITEDLDRPKGFLKSIYSLKCISKADEIALLCNNIWGFKTFFNDLTKLCIWRTDKDIISLYEKIKKINQNEAKSHIHPLIDLIEMNYVDYVFNKFFGLLNNANNVLDKEDIDKVEEIINDYVDINNKSELKKDDLEKLKLCLLDLVQLCNENKGKKNIVRMLTCSALMTAQYILNKRKKDNELIIENLEENFVSNNDNNLVKIRNKYSDSNEDQLLNYLTKAINIRNFPNETQTKEAYDNLKNKMFNFQNLAIQSNSKL